MLTLWSEALRLAIEREVVGQPRAVRAVVRALVHGAAGLADGERPRGVFLFLGPTGTGKTHLPRVVARLLHGTAGGIANLDCTQVSAGHGRAAIGQVALNLAQKSSMGLARAAPETVPNAILVIDRPEEAPADLGAAIASALEGGEVPIEGGGAVSLRSTLLFLTSGLCAREIFEISGAKMGFQSATGDENDNDEVDEKIFDLCKRTSEAFWGPSFIGRLDAVVVFHRLRENHLPQIIERRVAELCLRLARRGVYLVVEESARRFLMEEGLGEVRFGARQLNRALRRFVEYPLGDRLVSGHLIAGQRVTVRAVDGELAFDIAPRPVVSSMQPVRPDARQPAPGAAGAATNAASQPAVPAWVPPQRIQPVPWAPVGPWLPAAAWWPRGVGRWR